MTTSTSFIDVRVAELCFSIKKEICPKKETLVFLVYMYFKNFSTNYYNSINLTTDCARFKMLTCNTSINCLLKESLKIPKR